MWIVITDCRNVIDLYGLVIMIIRVDIIGILAIMIKILLLIPFSKPKSGSKISYVQKKLFV